MEKWKNGMMKTLLLHSHTEQKCKEIFLRKLESLIAI